MAVTSVFISSTSSDLREHRAAVRESLLTAGYHPIDMADFMARAEGATSACLNEVAEADLFVGIYAWRYGFVPKGSKISITEQEFEEARLLEKPCFCFMVEESYDWPAQFKEEGKGGDLLKKFKAQLDSTLVRTTFTTPDSLAKRVLSSLTRWEKEQHKLTVETANQLLAGISSIEEAQDMIASVLDAQEVMYEVDESGFFNVVHGSTNLVIEVFSDHQWGLMVDFRASLAENVDPAKIPIEAGLDMLAMNWSVPMGAIALDAASGTLWFSYRVLAPMLTEEVAFSCMSFVADLADSMDDELSELLPTRPRRRSSKK
jgi:hypothetical protein